jgi:hypothetical protein
MSSIDAGAVELGASQMRERLVRLVGPLAHAADCIRAVRGARGPALFFGDAVRLRIGARSYSGLQPFPLDLNPENESFLGATTRKASLHGLVQQRRIVVRLRGVGIGSARRPPARSEWHRSCVSRAEGGTKGNDGTQFPEQRPSCPRSSTPRPRWQRHEQDEMINVKADARASLPTSERKCWSMGLTGRWALPELQREGFAVEAAQAERSRRGA